MNHEELIKLLSPLANRQDIPNEVRDLLHSAIARVRPSPSQFGIIIYGAVVLMLGITAIATVIGGIYLAVGSSHSNLPDAIVAIGSAAAGALGGLLTPTPRGR
jgi:hypothetical protein